MRQSLEKFFEEASPIIDSINGLRDFFEKSFNQYRYEIWSVFIEQNRSILTSDDCKYSFKSGPVAHSKMGHPREYAKLIKDA